MSASLTEERTDARIPNEEEMKILIEQFLSDEDIYGEPVNVTLFSVEDSGDVSGVFTEKNSIKTFVFSIDADGVSYRPTSDDETDRQDSDNFSKLKRSPAYQEGLKRAARLDDSPVKKGFKCKRGYISKDKECRTGNSTEVQKQRLENLRKANAKYKAKHGGAGGTESGKKLLKDERVKRLLEYVREQGGNFAIAAASTALGVPAPVLKELTERVLSVFGVKSVGDLVGSVFNYVKRIFGFGKKRKDSIDDQSDIYMDSFLRGYLGRSQIT